MTRIRGLARFGEARVKAHRVPGDRGGTANPMGSKAKQPSMKDGQSGARYIWSGMAGRSLEAAGNCGPR